MRNNANIIKIGLLIYLSISGHELSIGSKVRAALTSIHRCCMWRWMTVQKKKARPLLSSRAHCPNTYPLPFSIMMTLPLSHLAPDQPVKQWQRKSPFLSSQRTVPLALQGDGEHWSGISVWKRQNKERQTQRKRVITALKIESAQSGDIQCV